MSSIRNGAKRRRMRDTSFAWYDDCILMPSGALGKSGGVMDAIKSTIAAVGWLIANAALAQVSGVEGEHGVPADPSGSAYHSTGSDTLSALFSGDADTIEQSRLILGATEAPDFPYVSYFSVYRLTPVGGMMAAAGFRSLPTPAASVAFVQQQTGIDVQTVLPVDRWLNSGSGVAQTFVVGHAWRDLTLEGSAFSGQGDGSIDGRREFRKLDSRSARLSFSPAENWVVRLTRGTVSGLDHLVAGDEVRRTAVSATYRRSFAEGDWEATIAWGRNSRKFRESTNGYLVESAFRFDGVHSVFGRIEQVGSDELARENESLQRQLFMMNKLTLGYSQDLRLTSSLRMDAGAYVTRHFVPSGMAASYGSGPTTYMMFLRLKLQ